MIKTKARVIYTDNNRAFVEATKKSACGGCKEQADCGVSVLSKFFGNKPSNLGVSNKIGAQACDEVEIGMLEKDLLKSALRVYIVPLLGFFIFAIIGTFVQSTMSFDSELIVVLFAIFGMGLSWKLFKSADNDNNVILLKTRNKQTIKINR